MAMRQRLPVYLFRQDLRDDPLETARGVAAVVRAAANWAPDGGSAS